jgi:hypothetical protein
LFPETPDAMNPQMDKNETTEAEGVRGKERRRRLRVVCTGFAEGIVLDSRYLFRGEIRDFTESGCFVKTKARLHAKRLAEVDIRFIVNGIQYHTAARVMNVRPDEGYGLEFLFKDLRTQELFRSLYRMLRPKGR